MLILSNNILLIQEVKTEGFGVHGLDQCKKIMHAELLFQDVPNHFIYFFYPPELLNLMFADQM